MIHGSSGLVGLLVLLLVAGALRWIHLGATSLWWDEIVQIQTAALPRFVDVLWQVRRGDPPGLGNAGAVPLDYLLMHAWQRFVPAPGPPWIEAYFRFPSWFFSTATVGVLFLFARRTFGLAPALAAAALLATSVPHALYAGEARFYSLFTFVTVLLLWSFSWVVAEPRRLLAWLVHGAVGILTFLTGLLGLLLLAGQYAILLVLLLRGDAGAAGRWKWASRGRLVVLGLIAAAFAGIFWRYYRGTWLFLRLQHSDEGRGPWQVLREVLGFFTLESPVVLVLFVVSLALVPWALRTDRRRLAIALHLTTSLLWIPVLAWLAAWKGYYVRPRHALFLLPYLALLVGIAVDLLLRRRPLARFLDGRRPIMVALVATAVVVAAQLVPVVGYLANPLRYAARIKPTYDTRALVAHLDERAAALPDDRLYLLVSDRGPGAYLRNPAVAWYLRRYGLHHRVALRTAETSAEGLAHFEEVCGVAPEECADRWARGLASQMKLSASIQVRASLRRLLGIEQPALLPPRRIGAVGILRARRDPRPPASALRWQPSTAPGWALLEWAPPPPEEPR
jgi:hypothetical protein